MVGLDVTEKTILGADHLRTVQRAASPISQLVWSLTEFHLNERGAEGIMMHDPLAVGVAIDPSFVETKRLHVGVETKGEMTRGETVAARRGYSLKFLESHGTRTVAGQEDLPPNAEVCVGVDSERFLDFFVKRVLGDRR
jgi:inosine-uridine nucleoside N-ribohydrolase